MTEREIPGMVSSSIVNRKGKAMKYLLLGAGLQGTAIAWDLLHSRDLPQKSIRLLGVSISTLDNNPEPSHLNCHQLTLEF